MASIFEPARQLPIYGEFDVVVVGGGPAGLAASVSAARHGSRVLLVERYGFLGGMGTAGGVTNFAGLYGRKNGEMRQVVHGVVDDLLARMAALGGVNAPQDGMQGRIRVQPYDVSSLKCAADQLLLASGVQILFHAWAASVVMQGSRIQALVVETKSGRMAIRGARFIDCSGDADIAHFAGAPYELGDGLGSGLYPTTMFRVGHVDAALALPAVGEFTASLGATDLRVKERSSGHKKIQANGVRMSRRLPMPQVRPWTQQMPGNSAMASWSVACKSPATLRFYVTKSLALPMPALSILRLKLACVKPDAYKGSMC